MFNYNFYKAIEKVMTEGVKIVGDGMLDGSYKGTHIEKRGSLVIVRDSNFLSKLEINDWFVSQKYMILP